MHALVLAAGFGTRLWPLTADRTKPAVPFLGRPLVVHALSALARLGVVEAAVNLHYHPESVRAALRDLPAGLPAVRFSPEPVILGTAGAMDPLRGFLEHAPGPFVLMNGKVVCDLDLDPALAAHRAAGAIATLVLVENVRREPFREVLVHPDGRLAGFGAMPGAAPPGAGEARPPLAFTGIQFLEPAILDYVPRGTPSDTVRDAYPRAMADGRTLLGVVARGLWEELSTPRRYLEAHLAALGRRPAPPGADGPDRFVAAGAAIAPGARVARAVLWPGARVEAGAAVEDAVLGEGVVVPRAVRLAGGVAVRAAIADRTPDPLAGPGRPPRGYRVGDLLFVPFDDAAEAERRAAASTAAAGGAGEAGSPPRSGGEGTASEQRGGGVPMDPPAPHPAQRATRGQWGGGECVSSERRGGGASDGSPAPDGAHAATRSAGGGGEAPVSTPAPFAEPSDARARAHVAASLGPQAVVTPLSGDASDRRYFRVRIPAGGAAEARRRAPLTGAPAKPEASRGGSGRPGRPNAGVAPFAQEGTRRAPRSWVLAVHAAPFDPATLNTIDATRLFRAAGLPVPAIVEVDAARGVLRLEDLGDVRLQDALAGAPPARRLAWYREAVALIHGIHRATDLARSGGYQAGRLAFDVEKLGFEMGFFFTHYVEGLRGQPLPPPLAAAFRAELDGLVAWLAARPRVLAHRDYHARNLMVRPGDDARLVMVDHQDARLGPVTYDLASLVYDPYVELTPAEVSTCLEAFVDGAADRAAARAALAEELDRMALERLLKAVGTYGYQTWVRGTEVYLPYFVPALARARSAARRAGGFPATVEAVALLMCG